MRIWWGVGISVLLVAGEAAAAEPVQIGTTFSARQCVYLRLHPKRTLKEVLKTRFDLVRLAAYWDELEPQDGVYDFDDLDLQIAEVASKQVPIVLSVGMKAPRWPEYFIPGWVLKQVRLRKSADVAKNPFLRERTLRFIEAVVSRYRDDPAIHYWQVENEPMDRVGAGYWWSGPDFVKEEVALVRRLDPRHRPIILTTVTYPNAVLRGFMGWFLRHDSIDESLALCDILGVNVYPVVGHRWFLAKSYFWTSAEERHQYLASVMKRAERAKKRVWVTELQAEPWEPDALVYTQPEQPPTGDPAIMQHAIQELRALGIDTVLLWGVEYWQYRKVRYRDERWWDEVRRLLRKEQAAEGVR